MECPLFVGGQPSRRYLWDWPPEKVRRSPARESRPNCPSKVLDWRSSTVPGEFHLPCCNNAPQTPWPGKDNKLPGHPSVGRTEYSIAQKILHPRPWSDNKAAGVALSATA